MADGSYFLTRYDDLVAIYRDNKTWSSDKTDASSSPHFGDSPLYEHHTTSLVFNDPPIHTRVRKLLAPAFTPRALNALQPRDRGAGRPAARRRRRARHDRPDRGLRRRHPGAIDRRHARHPAGRARTVARLVARHPRRARAGAVAGSSANSGVTAVTEFKTYLRDLVAAPAARGHQRTRPKSSRRLIAGSEVAAPAGDGGDRLTELELLHNCIFLLNAGHETTTNLIGNSVDLLIRHPDAMRELAAHPELIETAVEEFLRMESSNQLGNRRAAADTAHRRRHHAGRQLRASLHRRRQSRPGAVPRPRPARSRPRIPTAISPSASASTPAPAIRSRAWRRRSGSASWCARFRTHRARRRFPARRPRPLPRLFALSCRRSEGETGYLSKRPSTSPRCCAPGLPPAAAKFTGVPPYNFTGGHNDPDGLPLDGLVAAANSVLRREGRTLATYGFATSGPQGHRPLREFLVNKLKRDAGIDCTVDNLLITSGSLQALELVNGVFLAPRRYRRHRTGQLSRHAQPLCPARRATPSASRSTATACGWTRCHRRSTISSAATSGRSSSTPFRRCRTRPAPSCRKQRRVELLRLAQAHNVPIFEDDCYCDLIWDGKRPPALYAMSKSRRRRAYRLVLEVDRPRAAGRLYRGALGADGAHPAAQDRRRLRRDRADGAGGILRAAFRRACGGAEARRSARNSTS